jgi:hypothetical protein
VSVCIAHAGRECFSVAYSTRRAQVLGNEGREWGTRARRAGLGLDGRGRPSPHGRWWRGHSSTSLGMTRLGKEGRTKKVRARQNPRAVFIPQSSCFLWPIWKRARRVINASQKHEASRGAPGSFARQEQKRLAQDDKVREWGRLGGKNLPSEARHGRPLRLRSGQAWRAVPTWPVVRFGRGRPHRESPNYRSVAMEKEVHQRGNDQ